MRRRSTRRPFPVWRIAALGLVLLAFALRCHGLDMQELRGDEAFGYFFSLYPLDTIVDQTLDLAEPHPVASYWLQHVWLGVAGYSEYALRFPGVWWSVLAVSLLLPLTTQLGIARRSGVVAMLLMALSPYAIWHAQDARMYSMSLALTLASSLCAVGWWRADTHRKQIVFGASYVAVTWLALHTHYFALYVVAAQQAAAVWWGIRERAWGKLVSWWLVGLLVVLAWLPWLVQGWNILLGYGGNGDSPTLVDALVRAHAAYGAGEAFDPSWRFGVAIVVVVCVGFGIWALWRDDSTGSRDRGTFLLFYWLLPLLATWFGAVNRPIFNERYLLAAVPPVYLLMAAASQSSDLRGHKWIRWLGAVLVPVACVIMVFGVVQQNNNPALSKSRGWRDLAAKLESLNGGADSERVWLAQNYPDPTLWYYYGGNIAHSVLPPAAHDEMGAQSEVARLVEEGIGRVLLVEQPAAAWDDDDIARQALAGEFAYGGETIVHGWPVSFWLRTVDGLDGVGVEYTGNLTLARAKVTPTTVAPGAMVEVHLAWEAGAGAVDADEAVSVQLLSDAGALVAQSDRPLLSAGEGGPRSTSYAILVPDDVPSGSYRMVVVVYDPGQEGAPRRTTLQGADSVVVAEVVVSDAHE